MLQTLRVALARLAGLFHQRLLERELEDVERELEEIDTQMGLLPSWQRALTARRQLLLTQLDGVRSETQRAVAELRSGSPS